MPTLMGSCKILCFCYNYQARTTAFATTVALCVTVLAVPCFVILIPVFAYSMGSNILGDKTFCININHLFFDFYKHIDRLINPLDPALSFILFVFI